MARAIGLGLGPTYGSGAKLASLGNPVTTNFNETFGNLAGDDFLPWANQLPIHLDKYGNAFTILLKLEGGVKRACFVWKNVGGAWTDNPILSLNDGNQGELALDQAMLAYDSANDIIHAFWAGQDGSTGMLYRRYVPIRDGSHNFTGIDWDYTDGTNTTTKLNTRTNLQIDFNGGGYTTMNFFWLNDAAYGQYGALVAMWSATGTSINELCASMCVFGANAQQGKTAANWTNLGLGLAGTAGGRTITIAYDALVSRNSASVFLPVFTRKTSGTHANDLYLGYTDNTGSGDTYKYTRLIWNGTSHNWPTKTAAATIAAVVRSGVDAGYSLKYQLMSQWAEDTANDRMYIAIATWKDNVNGDTVSLVRVDSADAITITDVASATGAWFFAPAPSVAFDSARGLVVYAYPRATDGHALVQLFKDTTPQGALVVATSVSADIPDMALGATVGGVFGGKVVFFSRTATVPPAPPYTGYYVTLDWQ